MVGGEFILFGAKFSSILEHGPGLLKSSLHCDSDCDN